MNTFILNSNEWILFLTTFSVILQPLCAMFGPTIPVAIFLTRFNAKTKIFNILYILYYYLLFTFIYRVIIDNELFVIYKLGLIFIAINVLKYNLLFNLGIWNIFLEAITDNPPMNIDKKNFEGHKFFENEENFQKIRSEVIDIVDNYDIKSLKELSTIFRNAVEEKNDGKHTWRFQFLKQNNNLYEILDNYPNLKNILEDKLIFNAGISILDPKISIPQHIGYFKGLLRYQICIETNDSDPDKPYIVCGGQKYTWKTGEGILFDDMYNHYVVNNSESRRIVLYLDIKRQNLPKIIKYLNNLICKNISEDKLSNYILKKQHIQRKNK
jgi:hypothetical protein